MYSLVLNELLFVLFYTKIVMHKCLTVVIHRLCCVQGMAGNC